LRGNAF